MHNYMTQQHSYVNWFTIVLHHSTNIKKFDPYIHPIPVDDAPIIWITAAYCARLTDIFLVNDM